MSEKNEKEDETVTFEVDPSKLNEAITTEFAKHFKELKELVAKPETPKSETEPLDEDVETDYRKGLIENLKKIPKIVDPKTGSDGWKYSGPEDAEFLKEEVGEVKVTDEKLIETIGAVTATNAIPEVWAAEVERLSQYPTSAFWNAPYVNWKTDIKGKPGDTVNVITVAPVTCTDFACEEPTTTAASVSKVPITLVEKGCAYYICKQDMEDVVPDTIDALNEGLSKCLAVCIDNYFLGQALVGTNAGTLTETGGMKGTIIAKAMGSMEAGNRHNSAISYII